MTYPAVPADNWRIRVGTVGSWVCLAFVFFVPIVNFTALGMGSTLGMKLIIPQLVALTLQHACFRLRRKGWSMREAQIFIDAMDYRDRLARDLRPFSFSITAATEATPYGITRSTP